ncbi:MAG: DUF6527 family protein [Nitrospirales bacterium]|nr:hypothetical protein [Nitrospirales bacterium]
MIKREVCLTHEFVEYIPADIQEGKIYISIPFATAMHKCCCGCGKEVVTPFSPTDWKLVFDGKSISLDPSIGNWSFNCQSHYWIKQNRAIWSYQWSQEQIQSNRAYDRSAKDGWHGKEKTVDSSIANLKKSPAKENNCGFWSILKHWYLNK